VNKQKYNSKNGQTLIFFLVVLVIMFFAVIWVFDLHNILNTKSKIRNAGDSAAVMGARWQGISLNIMGDLNIMNAIAIADGDYATVDAISNIQVRLAFTGPLIGFDAAQQAGKNNGIFNNDEFTDYVFEHANIVRNQYTQQSPTTGNMLFAEPYPGAWDEYATMLESIASRGIAVGIDNAKFYTDVSYNHYLLMYEFYDAIAGQNWCWFYFHAMNLLETYNSYRNWGPLPVFTSFIPVNSEILGLQLSRRNTRLGNIAGQTSEDYSLAEHGRSLVNVQNSTNSFNWYCYSSGAWNSWSSFDIQSGFPATGTVKPQYDYTGADSATRIETDMERLTPGQDGEIVTNGVTWTSAAKAFGYLNDTETPCLYDLVIPAFHDVRLIPLDTSSTPYGGAFDLEWQRHINDHLPKYILYGTSGLTPGCYFCNQLRTWERGSFRNDGIDWLDDPDNVQSCTAPSSGGNRGGGTTRGH
jgi:Flp pilus assembly protein TadG